MCPEVSEWARCVMERTWKLHWGLNLRQLRTAVSARQQQPVATTTDISKVLPPRRPRARTLVSGISDGSGLWCASCWVAQPVQDAGEEAMNRNRFCWESQLPFITLPAVVFAFWSQLVCASFYTPLQINAFSREKKQKNILILGTPLSTHSTWRFFAALICRTVENSRLILTHRYLVLVVFAGQHFHTARFELSHLLHCRGKQEGSFRSQVKVH